MSVQFGILNFEGQPVDPEEMDRMSAAAIAYGPDAEACRSLGNIAIGYRSFNTGKESRSSAQPYRSRTGSIVTWDGRLDNRAQLVSDMNNIAHDCKSDVEIVAAAYDRWDSACLAKLVGDWALVIWNPETRTLLLGCDFVGARHLYYLLEGNRVIWSTVLEPLVQLRNRALSISEEYIAGWLTDLPATHLTPFVEIHSVRPASFVLIRDGTQTITRYWDFDPATRIRYKSDAEYEEHFRTLFARSLQRRLRSNRPVLAELSGGMDSSAIVCMADALMDEGQVETPRLDTLSYYSDSEMNWDERPYFTLVEKKRNRSGCHIRTDAPGPTDTELEVKRFAITPGLVGPSSGSAGQLMEWIGSHDNRVLFSGIGGDEVLGGVPTATPELADLFASFKWRKMIDRMVAWALVQRKPIVHLVSETVCPFLPFGFAAARRIKTVPPWLEPAYVKRNELDIRANNGRLRLFGLLPSFQENLWTLEVLRRQLAAAPVQAPPMLEKTFPYLDRSLLEFLYAIPRDQIVRPGQRRSLMRRAMAGIVPDEILNRKRKAFPIHTPIAAISSHWSSLVASNTSMAIEELGIIDAGLFAEALNLAVRGRNVAIVPLARTLTLELWLRQLIKAGVVAAVRTGGSIQDLKFRDITAAMNVN